MAVHDELRELAEAVGADVLADGEHFRAVLDDFLTEGAATRGEINLLVDAVRLGTVQRLMDQIEHGADLTRAIEALGAELARDRGTIEATSARWALGALGFALGRVSAEQVESLRAAMAPGDGVTAPVRERPLSSIAVSAGDLASTTVRRPSGTLPSDDDDGGGEGAGDSHGGKRIVPVLLGVLVVVAVVAGLVWWAAMGPAEDTGGAARDGGSGRPSDFAPIAVDGGTDMSKGVRSVRTYRLTADTFASSVVLTNTRAKEVTVLWTEVVPKELAEHVSQVDFAPDDPKREVLESDPIVFWRLPIAAGASRTVTWTTGLPGEASPSADYLDRITGWHEEAVTAAQPIVREKLPQQRRGAELLLLPEVPEVMLPTDLPGTGSASSGAAVVDSPDSPTSTVANEPSARANRRPSLSISNQSSREERTISVPLRVSDPDAGDSWRITGASGIPGLSYSGRSLSVRLTHATASVTASYSSLRTKSFTVRVTIADGDGATASDSFVVTVTDDHRLMPNFVGTTGGSAINALGPKNFAGCFRSGADGSTIAKQSKAAGSIFAYGTRVTYTYAWGEGDEDRVNAGNCP